MRLVHGGSRRLRHLYIRSGYLAIMMLILLFALFGPATTMKQLAQRGASAFTVISFGQVGLLCLLTPAPARSADFHFENDILPVLGRYGCNSSGCHGKAEGQGNFKLSVFASDPDADHAALTKEARGRRVFPSNPDESLLLRKATGRTAHGGGAKLSAGGEDYRTLRNWIAAGEPREWRR